MAETRGQREYQMQSGICGFDRMRFLQGGFEDFQQEPA